ncbi:hypothetical protein OH77DRAFT_1519349 [Trametes cingulata]|nr:hypothetical protein OH77DRAFT_1519349 [Trametes cingulata]
MPEDVSSTHPHYALLEYARDMHQYTLELWLELSKKLDAADHHQAVPPELPPRDRDSEDSPSARSEGSSDIDAESPQETYCSSHLPYAVASPLALLASAPHLTSPFLKISLSRISGTLYYYYSCHAFARANADPSYHGNHPGPSRPEATPDAHPPSISRASLNLSLHRAAAR